MRRSLIVSGARVMINEKKVKLMPVDIPPHSRAIGINFQTSLFRFHAMEEQEEPYC